MKFCMITTFYPPHSFGGDAVFVHGLSNLLARHGHEVDVIHCIDSYRALGGDPDPTPVGNDPGVTVHGLQSGLGILSPLATQQTGLPLLKARAINRILSRKQFDVIHFHNVSLIGGPGILRYGSGIKLYTMHEHWLICPAHCLFKFNREPCERRSCFLCQLVHRRPPQWWRYSRLLESSLHHVDAFIALCKSSMDRHRADGLAAARIVQLSPFLSEARKQCNGSLEQDQPTNRPFFLFAGRLEKLKGLQTAIPVFCGNPGADLVVAGEGGYEQELRRLAGDSPHIHFVGKLSPPALQKAYARALAVLVPSVTYESFSLVILEAFEAGTPVIARNLGALAEIIMESGGGLLFDDNRTLREALERLQGDPSLRRQLGRAGYETYRRQWTEEIHLQKYLGMIGDIRAEKEVNRIRAIPSSKGSLLA